MKPSNLQNIMDAGLQLLQERGYNAFSYADIAEVVGIRKASIHYHFPSKQDLVLAVLIRYRKEFMEKLHRIQIDEQGRLNQLQDYFYLYRESIEDNAKLCLCSMLAAELNAFPPKIHEELNRFFYSNERWLEQILELGRAEGVFQLSMNAQEQARILVAFVQGVQLMARSLGDIAYFDSAVANILATLKCT